MELIYGTEPAARTQPLEAGAAMERLSPDELYQLSLYKWRYSLEARGFDAQQVRQLMFVKWLHATRRVTG